MANEHDDDLLRVEMRFKNARLYNAIMAEDVPIFGGKSAAGVAAQHRGRIKAFCDLNDLKLDGVYGLLNLTKSPLTRDKTGRVRLRAICQQLAGLLVREPEWLFPLALYEPTWRPLVAHLPEHRVQALLASGYGPRLLSAQAVAMPDMDESLFAAERSHIVSQALQALTPRQEKIIVQRFGLDGEDPRTLREVAPLWAVGAERIRGIEAEAIRRLRHPARVRRLKPFVESLR